MGPGAHTTTTGKALIRGLRRSIRDMDEEDLRTNLTEIRDKLNVALTVAAPVEDDGTYGEPGWTNASPDNYRSAIAQSD
jgi:hypothetical protein